MNTAQKTKVVQQKFRWLLIIKVMVGILICLAGIYLSLSAYAAHSLSTPHRKFDPEEAAVFAITPEKVKFPAADGLEIAGWFIPSTASDKALILVHGRNSSRTHEFGGKFPEVTDFLNHNLRQGEP